MERKATSLMLIIVLLCYGVLACLFNILFQELELKKKKELIMLVVT